MNIFPLVNRVSAKPGETTIIPIRLSAGRSEETVSVEVKDFIIAGGNYLYDVPDYPYSLKNYVEVPELEFTLAPGEVKEFPVKLTVPRGFPGAQGFASIFFATKAVGGNITLVLNMVAVIIVDVENPKRIDMVISGAELFDLFSEDCPKEFKEKYGDFGTVLKMKIKNTGNMALALNGELRLVSRELGRIVSSIPIKSQDFTIFPELEQEFTFFTQNILPSGRISLQFEGVSQGVNVAKSVEVSLPERKLVQKAVRLEPDLMFFSADRALNEKFQIFNLTPERFPIEVSVQEPLNITPARTNLMAYSGMTFYLRFDPKKATLEKGDNLFRIKVASSGEELKVLGNGAVVIRNGVVEPSFKVKMIEHDLEKSFVKLEIENDGKMTMEYSLIEKRPLEIKTLLETFMLLPGEKKTVSFNYELPFDMAINAVMLRSRIYQTEEWKEERLKWKE